MMILVFAFRNDYKDLVDTLWYAIWLRTSAPHGTTAQCVPWHDTDQRRNRPVRFPWTLHILERVSVAFRESQLNRFFSQSHSSWSGLFSLACIFGQARKVLAPVWSF